MQSGRAGIKAPVVSGCCRRIWQQGADPTAGLAGKARARENADKRRGGMGENLARVSVDPEFLAQTQPTLAYAMATMAAADGQAEDLRKFLEAGVQAHNTAHKIKSRGSRTETLLCPWLAACANGQIACMEACLEHSGKSRLSKARPDSRNALDRALLAGQEESAAWLLERLPGCAVRVEDAYRDWDPLMLAAFLGMEKVVLAGLRHGAAEPGKDLKRAAKLAAVCAFSGLDEALGELLKTARPDWGADFTALQYGHEYLEAEGFPRKALAQAVFFRGRKAWDSMRLQGRGAGPMASAPMFVGDYAAFSPKASTREAAGQDPQQAGRRQEIMRLAAQWSVQDPPGMAAWEWGEEERLALGQAAAAFEQGEIAQTCEAAAARPERKAGSFRL